MIRKSGFPEIAGAVSILNLTSIELKDSLLMNYDLQESLIAYSALILEIVNSLPDNKATNYLANQMIRSGTAPCLMHGEAQSSESRKDFIHKMRLPLKELRETYNALVS